MRKLATVIMITALGSVSFAVPTMSNPTYSGTTGVLAYPTAFIPEKTSIYISFRYTAENPAVLSPAIAIGLFNRLELSGGRDWQSGEDNPVLVGAKYLFYKDASGLYVATGLQGEIATASVCENYFTPYVVLSQFLSGFRFSVGLGYTFGPNIDHWNIFVGAVKTILRDRLWFLVDFANYPYRHCPSPSYAHQNRGVANVGLRARLTDFLQVHLSMMDVFDNNREFEVGATLRVRLD